jgi:hypothetical protein
LGSEHATPPRGLHHVAAQLDSSFCRRQWPDVAYPFVRRAVDSRGRPPGTPTIPDQIVDNRAPYFDALDAADAAWLNGTIDVSKMEELLGALLAKQLAGFYQTAGGKMPDTGNGL